MANISASDYEDPVATANKKAIATNPDGSPIGTGGYNPGVLTDKPDPKPNKPNDPSKPNNTYDLSVVPGIPDKHDPGQMNVTDYASQLATNPSLGFTQDDPKTKNVNESMLLSDHLDSQADIAKQMKAGTIDPNSSKFKMNAGKLDITSQDVDTVDPKTGQSYNVATTADKVANEDMTGAHGQLSQGAQISNAPQIDIESIANGTSPTGAALQKYASQSMTNIIDTSTAAGKLLAATLGEGNYTDSKATLKGQLDILQGEFTDPQTGEAKIPSWAAGTARNVSKIAAFKGMSGTAATAAMSQALLEASIPIAQADSQFFQTLTLQNLDNKQQSIINTANTLAKFEQTNVDNRMAAAIQNSKAFLEMDMANLSNEQQARVINNQNRVQSILEDAKSTNAERLFAAQSQQDMDKFYDNLNTQIKQYNSSQNLDAQKFNSTMEDSREKFYKEMQYNIAISNAKWRQTVQLQEDQQQHEAATTDVKNMVDLSVNQLNQIWDRSDSLLDYAWKSSEADMERRNKLAQIALTGKLDIKQSTMEGLGMLAGTFVGSGVGQSLLKGLFNI